MKSKSINELLKVIRECKNRILIEKRSLKEYEDNLTQLAEEHYRSNYPQSTILEGYLMVPKHHVLQDIAELKLPLSKSTTWIKLCVKSLKFYFDENMEPCVDSTFFISSEDVVLSPVSFLDYPGISPNIHMCHEKIQKWLELYTEFLRDCPTS